MADYTRSPQRFFYKGVSLLPEDALPQGKMSNAKNIRSYQEGTLTTRWGSTRESSNTLPTSVHSLFRLNDTSLFGGATPSRRFAGAGTVLYAGPITNGAYNSLVTGQSGNPLMAVSASPINSPRPYLYVADSTKMRKIDSSLNDYSIGIPTPTIPPTAALAAIQTTFLESVGAGGWVGYGAAVPSGAATIANRVFAISTYIIYDSGTTGAACVSVNDFNGIVAGTTVDIDTESVIVQEINPAVSPTTIGRILYDSGSSGACTIQPAGSFSVGQIEAASPDQIRRRYEDLNIPVPAQVTISRTVDFPVNSLVTLGGTETVRIVSVAMGQDGTQSFRCVTASTHANGDAIAGVTSFRAVTVNTHLAGVLVSAKSIENTLTPLNTTDPIVGGVQAPMSGSERNWGLVGTQATQPSDIIRFGIKVNQEFNNIKTVRLLLDVDILGGTAATFLRNYYMYEWRGNDLASAMQGTVGATTDSIADAQAAAVTQGQVEAQYAPQFGADASVIRASPAPPANPTGDTGEPAASPGAVEVPRTDGFVTAASTASRQIALGDDQWFILQCRVGDLTRVGTDTTRSLNQINSAAITVQAQGTTDTLTLQYSDVYITGGYGPDVGSTLPPYVYRYRYRSTLTGERSNPSPPMRGGIHPHRGRVTLTPGAVSGASQCDTVDWFRYGGALARWQFTVSQPNTLTPINDDNDDSQIDGGEGLRTDLFQPWPSFDLPRTGVAKLAGTALQWVSGDTFNTNWGAGSIIIVNTRASTLYRQPVDSTHLEVVDNCGEGATIVWSMPAPTLLGQPLPAMWGGTVNDVWFHFACGAAADPSILHWTHGNDPDATSDVNTLTVTSASEPLQNGFLFDGYPYVFSTERLFRITPTFGQTVSASFATPQITAFRADQTPCTKGLWSRWALAVAPEGVYFLSKDGIYLSAGGGEAICITDDDLEALFPQDGSNDPASVRGFAPIDFTAIARLKLTYVDQALYFDYVDVNGAFHTWMWELSEKRWTPDVYASGVTARLDEPGPQVHTNLYGCANGIVYQADASQHTDDGTPLTWSAVTPWANGDDARMSKQWGDAVVDSIAGEGYTVTPVYNNGANTAASTSVGASNQRLTTTIEVVSGNGVVSRNFGLSIAGTIAASVLPRPSLYLWEPAYVPKQTIIARRATDWENLGYVGAKFIQGVVIRANTFNADKLAQVQYEGGHVGASLTLLHDGETQYAYPISDGVWNPFVAELVRIIGVDDLPWYLLDWRWVWEPAPEAATQWQTQETTFDLPGFMEARDGIIAYASHCPVTLTVWHENNSHDYTLPPTNDIYLRYYQPFIATKGKWVRFRLTANSPFRVFAKDTKIRIQGWGQPGGYMLTVPFGGISRTVGAEI